MTYVELASSRLQKLPTVKMQKVAPLRVVARNARLQPVSHISQLERFSLNFVNAGG